MSDISTGQIFTLGQQNINNGPLNNIIGLASINSSFISGKNAKSAVSNNDSFVLVDNGGAFWRITGSALADGLVNAEPNFARIAVGQLQTVNTLINGDMQVMQRNNTFSQVTTALYGLDRWKIIPSGTLTGRTTITQNALELTQTANYPHTKYSSRFTVNTTQSSLAAGDFLVYSTKIERRFARPLFDGVHSFSLVLQSSVTGTFCAFIRDAGLTKSYIMDCAITSANVPQRFTFPNISALQGSLGSLDTDAAYEIGVCLANGTTFQGSGAGSWLTGNFVSDANQINFLNNAAATLDITLLQHEPGAICTPFFYQPFDIQRARCQRYYYKGYDYGTYAGSTSNVGAWAGFDASTSVCYVTGARLPVQQRIVNSGTTGIFGTLAGAAGNVTNIGTSADVAITAASWNESGVISVSSSAAFTANNICLFGLVSDVDY